MFELPDRMLPPKIVDFSTPDDLVCMCMQIELLQYKVYGKMLQTVVVERRRRHVRPSQSRLVEPGSSILKEQLFVILINKFCFQF